MKLNEKFIKTWERDKLEKPTMVCFRCPAVKTVRNSREVVNLTIATAKQKNEGNKNGLSSVVLRTVVEFLNKTSLRLLGPPGWVVSITRPAPTLSLFFFSLAPFTIAPGTI